MPTAGQAFSRLWMSAWFNKALVARLLFYTCYFRSTLDAHEGTGGVVLVILLHKRGKKNVLAIRIYTRR